MVGSPEPPRIRWVTQSWGSITPLARSATSGSFSATQRSLVTVKLATGTSPVASAQACGPPSSSMRAVACGAERLSFHSRASRTGSPRVVDEHHAVLLAADGDRLDAVEQAVGGLLPGLPPEVCVDLGHVGVGGAALADRLAGVGVAHHDLGVLRGAVHASHESHVRDPTSPGEPSLPAPTRGETAE